MSSSSPSEQRGIRVTKALAEYSAGKRLHLPIVQPGDAVAITAGLHRTIDALAVQRQEELRRDGSTLACTAGCSACCNTAVMVHEPEALRVAGALALAEHAEARAHFLARYPAWHQELGKDVERIRTLHMMGRVDDAERVFYRLQARRVMCAFNRDGLCTIYEVRPGICRNTHALDTAEHCQPGSARGPTVSGYEPMNRMMEQLPQVTGTLQDALRRTEGGPPDALCLSVHRLLTAPVEPPPAERRTNPPGNAPCPCGSGVKFKHCCDFDR